VSFMREAFLTDAARRFNDEFSKRCGYPKSEVTGSNPVGCKCRLDAA
jgi:hypothetical protein